MSRRRIAETDRPPFLASRQKDTSGLRLILFFLLTALTTVSAPAQIQQAWAVHYNNGILNGTNQAVKMALDSLGNIYITGFSQNTNTNLGYVTIKYAPNGTQVWATRYDSTNVPAATPAGLVLDSNNNVVVTGSAVTIKYDTNGNQVWTAPYNGEGIAMDPGGNAIVTGFAASFNAVKISPAGTNLWLSTYNEPLGPALSQAVAVDSSGNAYIAGENTYNCYSEGPATGCYVDLLIVKYDQNGNQLWTAQNMRASDNSVQVAGMVLDSAANVYVVANSSSQPYDSFRYDSNGNGIWAAFNPTGDVASLAHALAVESTSDTVVTGQLTILHSSTPNPIGTYSINSSGIYVWTNLYYSVPVAASVGTSIAVDQANSVYVTGYSPGTNSINDIVTIKYDQNGHQIWLQRYNGPRNGNAVGNAIAVDNNGNVYVTGYETTAAGGTEIVTIKYSPVTVQRRSDGTVLLQAQGSPGESFDIQASADLQSWLDLGIFSADTNGLLQFDDTNAPNFASRFYFTHPQ